MPTTEAVYTKEEMDAQARESHRLRIHERITSWKARLPSAATETERQLIRSEVELLTRQLQEPSTKRMLTLTPPEPQSEVATMIQRLQEEVTSLKAKVGEKR